VSKVKSVLGCALGCSSFHVQEAIGVKVKDETWNTHQWLSNPRRLAVEPSNAVLQHHCVRCGRDLVTDSSSNDSYAVFVSAISFDQLEDEVTKRRLGEPCRGRRLSSDDEDRNRLVSAFTISQGGGLSRFASMRNKPAA
jgi:hypothetical protein